MFKTIYIDAANADELTKLVDVNGDTVIRDANNPEVSTNPATLAELENGLRPGFTGAGYLDLGGTGDAVEYEVVVAEGGTYDFHVRYATSTTRPVDLAINDGTSTRLPFLSTDIDGPNGASGFNNWTVQTTSIQLIPGVNRLVFTLPGSGPNIDAFAISAPGKTANFAALAAGTDVAPVISFVAIDVAENVPGTVVADIVIDDADTAYAAADITLSDPVNYRVIAVDGGLQLALADGVSLDYETASPSVVASIGDVSAAFTPAPTDVLETPAPEQPEAPDAPFVQAVLEAEAGLVVDVSPNTARPANDTQIRNADNPEAPTNLNLDAAGLRPGYSGGGYVDMGVGAGSAGDSVIFAVDVPADGSYTLHFRYANGGSAPRPLALAINGEAAPAALAFAGAPTGSPDPWSFWMLQVVTVDLKAGANSVALSIDASALNGPNIDAMAVTPVGGTPSFFAPAVTSLTAVTVDEGTTGTVLDVDAIDADGATLAYALTGNGADDARFAIDANTGALTFQIAPDFEAPADADADNAYQVEIAVSDGTSTTVQAATITVADIAEGGPIAVGFGGAITGYSSQDRPQDGGTGVSVSTDGSTATLDGNLWKRVALADSYTIKDDTTLVLDLMVGIGADAPEIVAIGFDLNENPFDADRSFFQLGGTQTQGGFIDLRGTGTPNADGTTRFTIDLGAHAGTAITSLVLVNDDDSRASLGSSSFSNVQFVEGAGDQASVPVVVGGGIADRTVPENGSIEIDLPFEDADGDTLTYSFEVRDSAGVLVPNGGGLAIVDGVLSGELSGFAPGAFSVAVTASDGTASVQDVFTLTVENVNDAPVAEDVALEPFFGQLGTAFEGFDVNQFAEFFSDADGDALTFSVVGLPEGLTINEEGYVSGSPTAAGTFDIRIRATDADGLFDELSIPMVIEGPSAGDVFTLEAENFTGLPDSAFFATGSTSASNDRLILLNQRGSGSVSTELGDSAIPTGYYRVTAYVFDETDGASTFSMSVGGTPLLAGGAASVTLDDAGAGVFVNPAAPRGSAANAGNLKAVAFDTVVFVGPETVATMNGQAMGGESLRVDRFEFTRVEAPNLAPGEVALDGTVDENAAGAVVGTLSAIDPEGGAVTFTTSDPRFVVATNAQTGAAELRLAAGVALDFETDNGTTVLVTATDAQGTATTTELTLSVGDVNDAPVLGSGVIADQVFEAGTAGAVSLAVLGATDADAGDVTSYGARLAGGAPLPAGITLNGSVLETSETLAAGTYAIEVFATDGTLESVPRSFTVTIGAPDTEQPEPFAITIQAEAGTLTVLDTDANATDTTIRDAGNPEPSTDPQLVNGLRPGFTGTGYLDYGDTAGDRSDYTFDVPAAGTYEINVRYASNSARPLDLAVNGAAAVRLPFAATGTGTSGPGEGFNNWGVQTISVELAAGSNTLSFAIPTGLRTGPNLDSFDVVRVIDTPDTTADADGDLFLSGPDTVLDGAGQRSINFNIAGRDADIVRTEISFDGGATRTQVLPDADGDFVVDGSALQPGGYQATVYVTDAAGNTAASAMQIAIGGAPVPPFSTTVEAETFAIADLEADAAAPADTVWRNPANNEPSSTPQTSGPGLRFDEYGLRPGYEGEGYLDMGNEVGDAASFAIDAPSAGTYQLTIRYVNGGATDRPMTVTIGGVTQTVAMASTIPAGALADAGWSNWTDVTIDVELAEGANQIRLANTIINGPNIDNVTISREASAPVDTREQVRFEEIAKINFEPAPTSGQYAPPAGYVTPAGFLADNGAAYGARGNGLTYGWVDVENGVVTANPLAQPTGSMRYKDAVPGASDLQKTYAHFEYPGASATNNERAWEMALEDGTYQVTMSIGDTGGAYDSNYVINVEGQSFMPSFTPTNLAGQSPTGGAYNSAQDGEGFRSALVTGIVQVVDGRLTVDSIGGYNTEIQHIAVERVPDITPDDDRTADLDFSLFASPVAATIDGQTSISIGADGSLPTGIDPASILVVGVQLQGGDNRGPNIAHVENIKLVETLTGIEVPVDIQISGGADSMNIRPRGALKENTSYTLKVQDVLDLGSLSDPDGELRQFQDLTRTFVTGERQVDVPREVAFSTSTLLDGFADGAFGYTAVEFGPDGKLYVATITGEVHRWSVNADGSIDKSSQETMSLDYLAAADGERRGIVGFVFDPADPGTIWISDNAPIPRESRAFDTPEFSGRVSKITLGEGGAFEGATAETYISGLPRSGGDHLTNSLEFRVNPNADQAGEPDHLLYLSQGSNSAAGSPDPGWGGRPERLLNAAVLEIDPRRGDVPANGFDVRTEPVSLTDAPTTSFPLSEFNADGTYPGSYNPFAEDAVLKIYATGIRNAYDLVWHSNGNLYLPTNGTASGGKTPNDPTQPGLDTVITNSPKQYDYFFTVDEGGYYGHPNTLRDEYVLNGGNPTAGLDPNEVVGGNDGNSRTDGYQTGVQPDEDYDLDGVYNLGYNRSPNGATEYTGNAFGSNLKGAILFAQFSVGDNVRAIRVDAEGKVIGDDVLRRPDGSVIDNYIDPLDIIENPVTGQLYLMTLNRSNGASQLVLLTPAPGGVTLDLTADENGDLQIVPIDTDDTAAAVFQVNGLDEDVTALRVSFNGGAERAITLDAQNRFTIDMESVSAPITARLRVTDDALNEAVVTAVFTPGEDPAPVEYETLVTIQAEDRTPADGTAVTVATSADAQIQIRDALNPETGTQGQYVNGLRPGSFGTDGNTNGNDGVPGGYADFGNTNADFMTFTFAAEKSGEAVLRFRYANGGATDRPLQVEVNGTIVTTSSFSPTTSAAGAGDGWWQWAEVEVPASLLAGQNSVTLRAVGGAGPNIDQLEVLVPTFAGSVPNNGETVINGTTYVLYEAESAQLAGGPAVMSEDRNQSGAFVDFVGPDTETITWTVEVAEAGSYGLDILYALGAGKAARPLALSIDGNTVETLAFAANSNATETVWAPQSTTVQLTPGIHTITVTAPNGVGPNIDQLRITKAPVSTFLADHAEIDGSGRIELETDSGAAHVVNGSAVEFFFKVAADGIYKIDTAANANASNGGGLTWLLNGVQVDDTAFPGVGEAGEQSAYLELEAGTEYALRIVSDAPGASGLDYLDLSPAPGNANADIAVQSLDPAYFDDRLHFSYIENPSAVDPAAPPRDVKDSGTVRITNTGTEPLSVIDSELSGPFVLQNPAQLDGLTLAAGASVDVTVLFNRAAYTPPTSNVDATSTVFEGALRLVTNDADSPVATIDLAGFWQSRDEGGQEPNVNEMWRVFGFGNRIEGLALRDAGANSALSTKDVFAKTDETEVLSPYWRIAEGQTSAKITHLAAYHGISGATVHLHNPGNKGANTQLWNHEATDNQRVLPNAGNDTTFATRTFTNANIPDAWAGNEVFGISVAGLSTDPRLNPTGDEIVPGAQQGHTVKVFQAVDFDGNVIPNVYLGIMDYTGINYDYNDNMFVIEGVEPVGFGQAMAVSGLDAAAADDRLVFTNIEEPANAQQVFRNEATITLTNDGFAPLAISSITLGDAEAFEIVGTVPTSIAAGQSAQVTVRFVGDHPGTGAGAELFKSTLTINSDAYADGVQVIQLAGLAQEFSERSSEPTVAQIAEAFGYTTDVAQNELRGGGVVETIGDEVLMPYFDRLDGSAPVEVIQIAAFLNQGNVARLGVHGLQSSQVTNLFANDDQQGQTVLPDQLLPGTGAGPNVARGTIDQDGPFGIYISVDGRPTYSSWSDPSANRIDPNFGQLVGDNQGHLIRYFQAMDGSGEPIEGTFIGIQDYPGAGNYDYNDHMFVIKNAKVHSLTAAEDANGNGVNDALELDRDSDGTVDFFDTTNTPVQAAFGGTAREVGATAATVTINAALFDTGGQGIAYNDTTANDLGGSQGRNEGVDVLGNNTGIGWIANGEWVEYTIDVAQAGTYVLTYNTATSHADRTIGASFAQNGTVYATTANAALADTDSFSVFANSQAVTANLREGEQVLRLNLNGGTFDLRSFSIGLQAPVQTAFGGTPRAVGTTGAAVTINAALFDTGGQGVAYNDTTANDQGGAQGRNEGVDVLGNNTGIGWIADGEWVEYTIDVAQAGNYTLTYNVAGTHSDRTIDASFSQGGTVYATAADVAVTDTDSFTTFRNTQAVTVGLREGEQVLRLNLNGGSFDLRSFTLDLQEGPTQTAFGGTPRSVGASTAAVTINAAQFDTGGQGVAYNDTTANDLGGTQGRNEGVDVIRDNTGIGWIANGEWVEYTVNVEQAGSYTMTFNTASTAGGRTIGATFAQNGTVYESGTAAVADTDSYTRYQNTRAITLDLREGEQVIRLNLNGGAFDLRSFTLDLQQPSAAGSQQFGTTDRMALLASSWLLGDDADIIPTSVRNLFRASPQDDQHVTLRKGGFDVLDHFATELGDMLGAVEWNIPGRPADFDEVVDRFGHWTAIAEERHLAGDGDFLV